MRKTTLPPYCFHGSSCIFLNDFDQVCQLVRPSLQLSVTDEGEPHSHASYTAGIVAIDADLASSTQLRKDDFLDNAALNVEGAAVASGVVVEVATKITERSKNFLAYERLHLALDARGFDMRDSKQSSGLQL